MTWHNCSEGHEYRVIVKDDGIYFVDEYHTRINYCPYCGVHEDELV